MSKKNFLNIQLFDKAYWVKENNGIHQISEVTVVGKRVNEVRNEVVLIVKRMGSIIELTVDYRDFPGSNLNEKLEQIKHFPFHETLFCLSLNSAQAIRKRDNRSKIRTLIAEMNSIKNNKGIDVELIKEFNEITDKYKYGK